VGIFAVLQLLSGIIEQGFELHGFIVEDRKLRLQAFVLGCLDYHTFWQLANLKAEISHK